MRQPPAFPKQIENTLAGEIEAPGAVRNYGTTIPEKEALHKAVLDSANLPGFATDEMGGIQMFSVSAARMRGCATEAHFKP